MILPPSPENGEDKLGWRHSTYDFSTKSAYEALDEPTRVLIYGPWNSIWKWSGPQRDKVFLWLAVHDKLRTSLKRSRWGSGISPYCRKCEGWEESTLHALRDYPQACRVWIRLVASKHIVKFFSEDQNSWFDMNLNAEMGVQRELKWRDVFIVACAFI